MPPKGKSVFNAFAALDSEEENEDPVTFHQMAPVSPPVRLQKKKSPKTKEISSEPSSASSGCDIVNGSNSSRKAKKPTCVQQVQQLISEVSGTASVNEIIFEYLNIPRGICAYPILFGSSGDYSAQFGSSWTAEITLLGETECTYTYKSVSVATKKFQATISNEIMRKGSYDVFPGSFFIFNWTKETRTTGEYGGHQDIEEKELDPKAGIAPLHNVVRDIPSTSRSAPTSIWKAEPPEPEEEKEGKIRLSKQGKKKLGQLQAIKIARIAQLEQDKAALLKKQAEERKQKLSLQEVRWKFEMRCLLHDCEERSRKTPYEMLWKVLPTRRKTRDEREYVVTADYPCDFVSHSALERVEDGHVKLNPIAWQEFFQNVQDVLRCFS